MREPAIRRAYGFRGGDEGQKLADWLNTAPLAAKRRILAILAATQASSRERSEKRRHKLLWSIVEQIERYRYHIGLGFRINPKSDRWTSLEWKLKPGGERDALNLLLVLYRYGLECQVRQCPDCKLWFYQRRRTRQRRCPVCRQKAYRSTPQWRKINREHQAKFRQGLFK